MASSRSSVFQHPRKRQAFNALAIFCKSEYYTSHKQTSSNQVFSYQAKSNYQNVVSTSQTVKFSLPKSYENRCHRSRSHCFTGLVPVHNIFCHCFSSQKNNLFSKYICQHFIVQLPLAFKHGNSPSIPRIQARMQWFLCPLLENSLQRFEHGEIW